MKKYKLFSNDPLKLAEYMKNLEIFLQNKFTF